GVRSGLIYKGMQFSVPSPDKPAHFEKGDEIILPLGIYYDDCTGIEEFFELFVKYRENYHKNEIINDLPLSVSFEKIKDKYNKWNWFSPKNYYRVGISKSETEGMNNAWQTGWVGGGMVTESFLVDGDKETRDRAAANLRFIFTELSAPSGFIYGAYDGKRPVSDCFGEPHPYNMMLIRKSADILYFMMKQLPLLEERDYNIDYKENIQKLAQAFCDLWKKYGQFGQFIDAETGEILIGNSLSAGSAIGGLALAYEYFGDEEYKKTAIESCDYYYRNYTQKGITNGGPGEIFGACDSESAGGILESYITMFNVFGDMKYIDYATSAANQLLSWVMNYDFAFPKQSLFGRWNVKTSGSCFANVQNKHSAPGFCTLSGDSLFELYRITKNEIYLNAIRDTAHNITQYLITEQKQKIAPDTAGMITDTMNERVETSDWLEPLGEIFDGSCWCEASDCLTYSEIPGLYIDKKNDIICMIDHAEVKKVLKNEKWQIELFNPTDYDMTLKIFSENKNYRGAPKSLSDSETNRGLQKIEHSEIFRSGFRGGKYRVDYLKDFEKINIKSKETATIEI
ncbi:MAG: hypothetical protein KBT47_05375, partial [Armatimonadetes bacterium]|nr:hypothetical protein [Candidatus Hippobium faecium]